MDKFVTVKKPATIRAAAGKQDDKPERQNYRYNPYSVSKSNERRFENWKDKKRTERQVHLSRYVTLRVVLMLTDMQDLGSVEGCGK